MAVVPAPVVAALTTFSTAGQFHWERTWARTALRSHWAVALNRSPGCSGHFCARKCLVSTCKEVAQSGGGGQQEEHGGIRTLYCDRAQPGACSWPSSSTSDSPYALHWAAASLLASTASRFACRAGRSSASARATVHSRSQHRCQMPGTWHPRACRGGQRLRWARGPYCPLTRCCP